MILSFYDSFLKFVARDLPENGSFSTASVQLSEFINTVFKSVTGVRRGLERQAAARRWRSGVGGRRRRA